MAVSNLLMAINPSVVQGMFRDAEELEGIAAGAGVEGVDGGRAGPWAEAVG